MSGEYIFTKIVNLPEGYTQLDYIESTGEQYINTGFNPNPATTKVETTFQVTNNTKINQRLFGARKNYSDVKTMCNIFWNSQQMVNAFRIDWVGNVSTVSSKFSLNTDITMICENNIVTINSVKYNSSTNKSTTYLDSEFYINVFFDTGNTTSVQSPAYVKWKTFKIYDDGTLVRDFIPCKNSDNEVGLYDLVENKFYSNSGTGSFVAGDEVVEEVGDKYYGVIPVADYRDICDAVREKTHTDALMLPPEVAAKIRSINPTPGPSPTPGEWVRPEGWPDLDDVNLTGFDGVYLTYDLSKTEGYGWIGLYATTADRTPWTVERGHLEAGQFVADRTEQAFNSGFFREPLDDTYGTIQLWRVSASGHITELKFVSLTATNSSNMTNNLQPCVERAGRLPYVVDFGSGIGTSQGDRCCGTRWMQHDKLLDVSSVTTLVNAWNSCCSLQSLDLSGWDTGSVTNMSGAWNTCYSLRSLDISEWDVSSVTNLQNAWNNCYSLQSLNLSGWDVSSVTNLSATWANCYSLQSLNLSGWNVSSVTSLRDTWANCYSLQSLNLSGWDVSHLSTNVAYPNGSMLTDYWPSVISINQNYNNATALSIASLLRIIDSLPVVTEARTLTLGQTNKLKLTAEQIAVATQKGWTVA